MPDLPRMRKVRKSGYLLVLVPFVVLLNPVLCTGCSGGQQTRWGAVLQEAGLLVCGDKREIRDCGDTSL